MITDEETTFVKERQMDLDIAHGIRLEILPLDGCPSSRFKRKMQLMWGLAYQIYINQEAPTSKGKGFYLIGKMMLLLAPGWKNRYRMARLCERHMTKYPIEECDHITEQKAPHGLFFPAPPLPRTREKCTGSRQSGLYSSKHRKLPHWKDQRTACRRL